MTTHDEQHNGQTNWLHSTTTSIPEEIAIGKGQFTDPPAPMQSVFLTPTAPSTPPSSLSRPEWSKFRANSLNGGSDISSDDSTPPRTSVDRRRRSLPPGSQFAKGGAKDKASTLTATLERLESGDVDLAMFRKLVRLLKDTPVNGPDGSIPSTDVDSDVERAIRNQLANKKNDGAAVDVWGEEGERFADLIEALIRFLERPARTEMVSVPGEKVCIYN